MSRVEPVQPLPVPKDYERLRGTVTSDAIPVELVSAFAGDRPMTEVESVRLALLKSQRGSAFFSDLLYAISHHYFAPEIAEGVWGRVLSHKFMMSEKLERNVRVTVATLDYLANITGDMKSLTLMSEASVTEIVAVSLRDGMTGLFNHSTFYELLELEFRNHRRYGVGVGLVLVDIDQFKLVNDRLGHPAGNRVLIELATTLQEETRDSDICCRFGGDEFAVILPFTNDPREACGIAERIRTGFSKRSGNDGKVTLSAGVALCGGSIRTSRALVERADAALYQAKGGGRNCVVLSSIR